MITGMERILVPAGRIAVRDPVRPETLRIASGTAWVTQAGDHRDHVVRAGRTLTVRGGARVVVQVLAGSCVELAWDQVSAVVSASSTSTVRSSPTLPLHHVRASATTCPTASS